MFVIHLGRKENDEDAYLIYLNEWSRQSRVNLKKRKEKKSLPEGYLYSSSFYSVIP